MNALLEARSLLYKLGLSGCQFNRDILLKRLESRIGIKVVAVPDTRLPAGGISGARITTDGSHVVFYPAGASDRLQLAVICHECAHLVLDHTSRSVNDVLAGTNASSPHDELAAEALGAALVHFAERPERLWSLVQGVGPPGSCHGHPELRAKLRDFFQPHVPGRDN